ncbi:MAG: hypothetical protein KC449_25785 [Anaerolineales bacterium]|nr:hypothetical protein [Anaerolineales bacterium]
MIDINYNRQDKRYEWIEPESGELFTFPAKQKHMAFRFAVSMLDGELYEAAERMIEAHPQLERVTWRAVELVCANAIEVFPVPSAGVVAMVDSSDGYGRYAIEHHEAGYSCQCEHFTSLAAPLT